MAGPGRSVTELKSEVSAAIAAIEEHPLSYYDSLVTPQPDESALVCKIYAADDPWARCQSLFKVDCEPADPKLPIFPGWQEHVADVKHARHNRQADPSRPRFPWKMPLLRLDQAPRKLTMHLQALGGDAKEGTFNRMPGKEFTKLLDAKDAFGTALLGVDAAKSDPYVVVTGARLISYSLDNPIDDVGLRLVAGKNDSKLSHLSPPSDHSVLSGALPMKILPRGTSLVTDNCLYSLDAKHMCNPWFSRVACMDPNEEKGFARFKLQLLDGRVDGTFYKIPAPTPTTNFAADPNLWLACMYILSNFASANADWALASNNPKNKDTLTAMIRDFMYNDPGSFDVLQRHKDPWFFVVRADWLLNVHRAVLRQVPLDDVFCNISKIGVTGRFMTDPATAAARLNNTHSQSTAGRLMAVACTIQLDVQAWGPKSNMVMYRHAEESTGSYRGFEAQTSSLVPGRASAAVAAAAAAAETGDPVSFIRHKQRRGEMLTSQETALVTLYDMLTKPSLPPSSPTSPSDSISGKPAVHSDVHHLSVGRRT